MSMSLKGKGSKLQGAAGPFDITELPSCHLAAFQGQGHNID